MSTVTQAMALIDDREVLIQVSATAQALPGSNDKALALAAVSEALIQAQRRDEAAQAARVAVEAAQAIEYEHAMEPVFDTLAPVLVQLGEHANLKKLLQIAKGMDSAQYRARALALLALALAQAGMTEEAEEAAGQALASVDAVEDGKIGTYL